MTKKSIPDINVLLIGANSSGEEVTQELMVSYGYGETANLGLYRYALDQVASDTIDTQKILNVPYSSMLVCFDVYSLDSFKQAQSYLSKFMSLNESKLLPVPIFLVGINPQTPGQYRTLSQNDSQKLASNLGLTGYYDVPHDFITSILKNPNDCADATLFSVSESPKARKLNQAMKTVAIALENKLHVLADPITKLTLLLENITIPDDMCVAGQAKYELCNRLKIIGSKIESNGDLHALNALVKDASAHAQKMLAQLDAVVQAHEHALKKQSRSIFYNASDDITKQLVACISLTKEVLGALQNLEHTVLDEMDEDIENRRPVLFNKP